MEERVPIDGKDDPPPPPLNSPSSKKHPPPPRRSDSIAKSEDAHSFTFPIPPSSQEIEPDVLLNNASNHLFNNNTTLISSLSPPPNRPSETYIVQVPKEQIFRVPPPENARIIESFGNPEKKKWTDNICLWILIAFVIVGLIVVIGAVVVHLFYNPKSPSFSITSINIVEAPSPNRQWQKPEFQISLQVENPNERLSIDYESGGVSLISFNDQVLGKGNYPSSSQENKNSMIIQIKIPTSSSTLPPEIKKSANDKKSKTELSFDLTIHVPVKFTSWMQPTKKDLTVSCDFKVNTLAKGSKIIDQQCSS